MKKILLIIAIILGTPIITHASVSVTRNPTFSTSPIYSNPTYSVTASTASDLINLAEYTTGTCGAGQYWDIMIASVDPNSVTSQYYVSQMFPTSQLSGNINTWFQRPGGGSSTSTISSPNSGFGNGTLPLSTDFTSGNDHYVRTMVECYTTASLGSSRTGFGIQWGLNDSYGSPDAWQLLPVPSPKVQLVYPYQGVQTPEFSTWVISQEFLYSTSTGYFGVNYGQNSSSLNYTDTCGFENHAGPCQVKLDPNDSSYTGGIIQKTKLLVPNSIATTTWYAQPYFYDSNSMVFHYGSSTEFQVANVYSMPNSTSSIQALAGTIYTNPSGNTTSTLSINCKPAADWTDVGGGLSYGLCMAGQFLFQPHQNVTEFLTYQYNSFKGIFPFSIIYLVNGDFISNATSSSGNYDLYLDLNSIRTGLPNIPLLTSSTLENAVGSSTKNFIFTIEKNAIWIGATIASLLIIL